VNAAPPPDTLASPPPPWRSGKLLIPVLEIGGTHVTAALVEGGLVVDQHHEVLDSAGTCTQMIDQIVAVASKVRGVEDGSTWGIAIPGPFRYTEGIGDFRGVDKFQAFQGVDVGSQLLSKLPWSPLALRFINDAEAYALGEWDTHHRPERLICITLGTGTGSGFISHGQLVRTGPEVPPGGNLHTQTWREQPLESTVSRRAIRRQFTARSGKVDDVKGIAQRCRAGDPMACEVLDEAMEALGTVLGRYVDIFLPNSIIVGGSIALSWDVIGPRLNAALSRSCARRPSLGPALLMDAAPLIGAAIFVGAEQPHGRIQQHADVYKKEMPR
jgi:glucokinase